MYKFKKGDTVKVLRRIGDDRTSNQVKVGGTYTISDTGGKIYSCSYGEAVQLSDLPCGWVNPNTLELVPKPHKHAELIHAWADGATIETRSFGSWRVVNTPSWSTDKYYRIKPKKLSKKEAILKQIAELEAKVKELDV